MGRDKFCEILMDLGYGVKKIKNYKKTTISGNYYYPNLIEGMIVSRPNQLIQTDITYYEVNDKFYYIVFIIDVYTREILGYNVGDNLRAESNVKALKMALKKISKKECKTMIHHSDRGSQYTSNMYVNILIKNGIEISMGLKAQDNAYAERINGTIKNEYLKHRIINNYNDLIRETKRAVNHYNKKRKHLAFKNNKSPIEFKESLLDLLTQKRQKVIIYAERNYKIKEVSNFLDFNPKKEPQAHNCPIEIFDEVN